MNTHVSWMGTILLLAGCAASHEGPSRSDAGPDARPDARAMRDAGVPDLVDAPPCGPERCDGRDEDCDGHIDEDAVCTFEGGTGVCAGGDCLLSSCDAGRADCNGDPGDGCEVLLGTQEHCGGCGDACLVRDVCVSSGSGASCELDAIVDVDPELNFTAVLMASGRLVAWGTDIPLPSGERVSASAPLQIEGVPEGATLMASTGRTLFVVAEGRLYGWGSNASAELGLGYVSDPDETVALTEIALDGPIVDLDASATPWIGAIGEGDVVWFWSGVPREGELPEEQRRPRRLGPDEFGPIRGLSVAADSMIMVQRHLSFLGVRRGGLDGSGRSYDDVFLWGVSVFGPTLPGPLACSSSHCCADHIPSGLMCWGAWAHGALAQRDQDPPPIYGLNSSVQGLEPTGPEGHVFLRGLATSDRNATCILREDDGRLYCWGHAAMNGLGAETDVDRPAQVLIDDPRPLTGLYGEHNFCVRLGERALRCWGDDTMSALGGIDGADPRRPSPVLGFE